MCCLRTSTDWSWEVDRNHKRLYCVMSIQIHITGDNADGAMLICRPWSFADRTIKELKWCYRRYIRCQRRCLWADAGKHGVGLSCYELSSLTCGWRAFEAGIVALVGSRSRPIKPGNQPRAHKDAIPAVESAFPGTNARGEEDETLPSTKTICSRVKVSSRQAMNLSVRSLS